MSTELPIDYEHQWEWLVNDLKRRTREPKNDVSFVLYVLTAIVGIGGLGIWVEIVKYAQSSDKNVGGIIIALSAFFPALTGSAAFQLVLDSLDKTNEDKSEKRFANKILSTFAIATMVAFFGLDLLLVICSKSFPNLILTLCCLCSMASVWVWWVSNADQKTFRTKPPSPEQSVGGSTEKPLPGGTDGFKV